MSTIMVIDDVAVHRTAITRLLETEGYDVVAEPNGRLAVEAIRTHQPDLILLDIEMPELDGLSLLEILHEHPVWRHVPVIMLTSISDTHSIRRARQLGAKEFYVKAAFSVSDMLDHVRKYTALAS